MSSLEAEIVREWKEKLERAQAAAQDKMQREQDEWQRERLALEGKLAEHEKKVCYLVFLLLYRVLYRFCFYFTLLL